MTGVTEVRVGQPYPGWRPGQPPGHIYQYDRGGHALLHLWPSPSRDEVRQVRGAPMHVAVVEIEPVVWLCVKYGPQPWQDAPYSWHLVPEMRRQLPPEQHGTSDHAALQVVLVDADTGLVRALRVVTLGPPVTAALHGAIQRQAEVPWDVDAYHARVDEVYGAWTGAELAEQAIAAERIGGTRSRRRR